MIKYRLLNTGHQLIFQVLEMDEAQRRKSGSRFCYQAPNDVVIISENCTTLTVGALYLHVGLWGQNGNRDQLVAIYPIEGRESKARLDKIERDIHAALAAWAHRGGFDPVGAIKSADQVEPNVWEL